MTAIQANLAEIGIKVKIQQMDSASWSKKFYDDGASTMSMIGGDGGGAAGGYGFGTLHSASAWPKGGNGWKGYHYENPELDAALEAVISRVRPGQARRRPPERLPHPCRRAAVHQPVGDDPVLVHQQPDRQLRQHPWPGHGQLLQGSGDLVRPLIALVVV